MDIEKEIHSIIAKEFGLKVDEVSNFQSASDIKDWDSIGQIQLVIAIEEKFNLSFEIEEIFEIITIGSIINIVNRKMGNKIS